MPKKWGYKDGQSKIFDTDEDGQLPDGWSKKPPKEGHGKGDVQVEGASSSGKVTPPITQKKWGYKDTTAQLHDVGDDGHLPEGWSEEPLVQKWGYRATPEGDLSKVFTLNQGENLPDGWRERPMPPLVGSGNKTAPATKTASSKARK